MPLHSLSGLSPVNCGDRLAGLSMTVAVVLSPRFGRADMLG